MNRRKRCKGESMENHVCAWVHDEYDRKYHDEVWGKPCHDDHELFEMLILEGMQAGLSWNTILKKRDNFKKAFDNFDVHKIANYDEDKIQSLLQDAGIIRNRLKIRGTVKNAKAYLLIQQEFGSFDQYLWSYVDHSPIVNKVETLKDVPVSSPLSDTISKDMKNRGFTFVGTTIIYAYMQAVGMVNDHEINCPEYHNCITK